MEHNSTIGLGFTTHSEQWTLNKMTDQIIILLIIKAGTLFIYVEKHI